MKIEYLSVVGKYSERQSCPDCCFRKQIVVCLPFILFPCVLSGGFENSQGDIFKL